MTRANLNASVYQTSSCSSAFMKVNKAKLIKISYVKSHLHSCVSSVHVQTSLKTYCLNCSSTSALGLNCGRVVLSSDATSLLKKKHRNLHEVIGLACCMFTIEE